MEIKTYIFDIDETICKVINKISRDYHINNLVPDRKMISTINKLFFDGNHIVILTGRGSTTGIDWKEETENQLRIWGVKYHELKFIKKPANYVYVDDKALTPKEFLKRMNNVL